MAQTEDVLDSLETMSEILKETLRETSMLRKVAVEEEVLMGVENINKTWSSTLRYARHVKALLTSPGAMRGRNR